MFTLPLELQRYTRKYEIMPCDFVLYGSGIWPEEYILCLKLTSALQLAARDPLYDSREYTSISPKCVNVHFIKEKQRITFMKIVWEPPTMNQTLTNHRLGTSHC